MPLPRNAFSLISPDKSLCVTRRIEENESHENIRILRNEKHDKLLNLLLQTYGSSETSLSNKQIMDK